MNYEGRYICLTIDKISNVVEAEITHGQVKIYHCFSVDTSDECNGERILNLQRLVTAICSELIARNVWSHKILIASSCLGINVELLQHEIVEASAPFWKKDVSQMFSKSKETDTVTNFENEINLGKCTFNGEKQSLRLHGTIERSLSNSLYNAFAQMKYDVVSVEDLNSAVLAWRSLGSTDYDENGKVIINVCAQSAKAFWCVGDVPIVMKTWALDESEDISYQLSNYIMRDLISLKLRNPKVIFASNMQIDYANICAELTKAELNVYDLRRLIASEAEYDCSCALPLALLFKVYNKHNLNLIVRKKIRSSENIIKQYKIIFSCSILAVAISSIALGANTYNYISLKQAIKNSPKEFEISDAEKRLETLQAKNKLLANIDNRTSNLVNYIGQYPGVTIATIDTYDMLPKAAVINADGATTIADDLLNEPPATTEPVAVDPNALPVVDATAEKVQEEINKSITVRGYSMSADIVTRFLSELQLRCNSKCNLNGITKILDTDVYAFEIEVTE